MENKKGIVLLITGLSGSGKTTLAKEIIKKRESVGLYTSLLDGDEVRASLSPELGFSKEDRNLHLHRMGYIAREISLHRGFCIISSIAPFKESRDNVIKSLKKNGSIVIVIYVSTSLEICELRDPKGFYKKSRNGLLKNFTGIDDPYEKPTDFDIELDLGVLDLEGALNKVEEVINKAL